MSTFLMLHGIDYDMFGRHDPAQYGTVTLAEIDQRLRALGHELCVEVESFQTKGGAEMSERIHRGFTDAVDGVLINAGAWTHYSYGIRDALAILTVPIVEIHRSNIYSREVFRHQSVFGEIVKGRIRGFGVDNLPAGEAPPGQRALGKGPLRTAVVGAFELTHLDSQRHRLLKKARAVGDPAPTAVVRARTASGAPGQTASRYDAACPIIRRPPASSRDVLADRLQRLR